MDTPRTEDDLEAVRTIVTALTPFKQPDQERIIRWAREKLGFSADIKSTVAPRPPHIGDSQPPEHLLATIPHGLTIKQFVEQKSPKSDNQFAAVIAYFHRFEGTGSERKETITADDLLEACRKASRERLKKPAQTLINAHHSGLLDKGGQGEYMINSVGENLVAMALPGAASGTKREGKRARSGSGKSRKTKSSKSKA